MKIAIIGAGCAGLVAARYCLKNNLSCDVYEQTDKVGGLWNYNEKIGLDDNGLPIHTVMYKDLRANVPKQLMAYYDFPYPEKQRCYPTQFEVLSYIHRYIEHFNLLPVIKFWKQIINITPSNKKWKITIMDAKTKLKEIIEDYDAVMLCNGHHFKMSMPDIEGMRTFLGMQLHSKNYRSPERFIGLRVLIIGAGASGQDISAKIATVAKKTILSHTFSKTLSGPPNVIQKNIVKRISGNDIIFQDDTTETVDAIVYCTGYEYDFPFLDEECGVRWDQGFVQYLYKHIINVEHPTMGFIGICRTLCAFPGCDVQVQFFLATLLGKCSLKSKADMIKEIDDKIANGVARNKIHKIGEEQKNYCDELAKMANFTTLPPVLQDLYVYVMNTRNVDDCFKILDDYKYITIDCTSL